MLARLNAVEGIQLAEVDHSGELLRVRARTPADLDRARAALLALGYEASAADPPSQPHTDWFDVTTVRQLSREEATIITDRVLSLTAFGLAAEDRERLQVAVAAALYGVFATSELDSRSQPGLLRAECARAVETAAAAIVGGDRARQIAMAFERDIG